MDSNENIEKDKIEEKEIQNNISKDSFNDNKVIIYSDKNDANIENEEETKNNEIYYKEKKIVINRNYSGKFERYDSDYCTNSESQSAKCLIY